VRIIFFYFRKNKKNICNIYMSNIPSGTYTGSGEALILNAKCNKLIPFTSSYTWTNGGNGSNFFLPFINYEN